MATGVIAECDGCGRVVPYDEEQGFVPPGWFDLTKSTVEDDDVFGVTWGEFCSVECLRRWVYSRRFHDVAARGGRRFGDDGGNTTPPEEVSVARMRLVLAQLAAEGGAGSVTLEDAGIAQGAYEVAMEHLISRYPDERDFRFAINVFTEGFLVARRLDRAFRAREVNGGQTEKRS